MVKGCLLRQPFTFFKKWEMIKSNEFGYGLNANSAIF